MGSLLFGGSKLRLQSGDKVQTEGNVETVHFLSLDHVTIYIIWNYLLFAVFNLINLSVIQAY